MASRESSDGVRGGARGAKKRSARRAGLDKPDAVGVKGAASARKTRVAASSKGTMVTEQSSSANAANSSPNSLANTDALGVAPAIAHDVRPQAEELVELFPQGISVGSNVGRPVLILKDRSGVDVLPVWMHPLDAGVALAELSQGTGMTPHSVVRRMMRALEVSVESCTFTELVGHHQFVEVVFRGHPKLESLRVRADEAMSFCLQARARFFSTKAFMARCRDVDSDMARLEESLTQGSPAALQAGAEISTKKHPYVM